MVRVFECDMKEGRLNQLKRDERFVLHNRLSEDAVHVGRAIRRLAQVGHVDEPASARVDQAVLLAPTKDPTVLSKLRRIREFGRRQ